MIHWHDNIYLGENIRQRYDEIKASIEKGIERPDIYVIALSTNADEQLDIFWEPMFLSEQEHRSEHVVVGLASSRDEANEMVAAMALEAYSETGKIELKGFFDRR